MPTSPRLRGAGRAPRPRRAAWRSPTGSRSSPRRSRRSSRSASSTGLAAGDPRHRPGQPRERPDPPRPARRVRHRLSRQSRQFPAPARAVAARRSRRTCCRSPTAAAPSAPPSSSRRGRSPATAPILVIRQLEQDVDAFNAYCETQAAPLADRLPEPYEVDADFVAAKLIGRWKDGSSLVRNPYYPYGTELEPQGEARRRARAGACPTRRGPPAGSPGDGAPGDRARRGHGDPGADRAEQPAGQ